VDVIFRHIDKITYYAFGIASILGLAVSLYVLAKVRSVRKAQEGERKFLQGIYGLKKLIYSLKAASGILGRARDAYSKELAQDLLQTAGQIHGINQALRFSDVNTQHESGIRFSDKNYFTIDFLTQRASETLQALDILCYRNMQVTEIDVVESFHKAASREVKIRILAISSSSPDCIHKEVLHILPQPRLDSSGTLKEQLEMNERRLIRQIQNQWRVDIAKMLQYRGYTMMPTLHFLRSDKTIYVGFLNILQEAQSKYLDERPCMEISTHSTLGIQLMAHFEALWATSSKVWPHD